MPAAELVILDSIDGFTPEIRASLRQYWITTAQEFLDLLQISASISPPGQDLLGASLKLNASTLERLYQAAKAAAPGFSYDARDDDEAPAGGCLFDEGDLNLPRSYPGAEPLPDMVLGPQVWPTRDQGQRNACVAFTAADMYWLLAGSGEQLSEQFLFWAGKQYEDANNGVGIRPASIFKALSNYGVCEASHWAYNPNRIYRPPGRTEDVTQGPPPQAALADAPRRKILGHERLHPRDIDAICDAVHKGRPVLIGMPYHKYWTQSYQGGTLGRIRPPLKGGETLANGHAMCVVGFRADDDAPGAGYFVVRNSWGAACGAENADGPGYCHIPYDMIAEYNNAAYVITALAPKRRQPTSSSTATAAGEVPGDLAEARALLARIQADADRLREVLARMGGGEHA